jgi:hypothetical protein
MSPARDEFDALQSASDSAPLGWRLGMALCNLLIGATIIALVVVVAIAAYDHKGIGLF